MAQNISLSWGNKTYSRVLKRKDEPKDLQVAETRDGTIAREELEEEDLKVETPFPLSACQVNKA